MDVVFATGVIRADPSAELPVGSLLHFRSVRVQYKSDAGGPAWLQDWGSFQGVLLHLQFRSPDRHQIDGSAVMVAPGIALCASHVMEPILEDLIEGRIVALGCGISRDGLTIWRLKRFTLVPGSDVAILGFVLASDLPSDSLFHTASITTRCPKAGERLLVCGFRSEAPVSEYEPGKFRAEGKVIVSPGRVTNCFVEGRDRVFMPFPAVEVECPSWGGMSGGPVFDESGKLVGLLSSSFESAEQNGPSYACLLWSALGASFTGGWPEQFFQGRHQTLLGMDARLCNIDDRTALEVEHRDGRTVTCYKL